MIKKIVSINIALVFLLAGISFFSGCEKGGIEEGERAAGLGAGIEEEPRELPPPTSLIPEPTPLTIATVPKTEYQIARELFDKALLERNFDNIETSCAMLGMNPPAADRPLLATTCAITRLVRVLDSDAAQEIYKGLCFQPPRVRFEFKRNILDYLDTKERSPGQILFGNYLPCTKLFEGIPVGTGTGEALRHILYQFLISLKQAGMKPDDMRAPLKQLAADVIPTIKMLRGEFRPGTQAFTMPGKLFAESADISITPSKIYKLITILDLLVAGGTIFGTYEYNLDPANIVHDIPDMLVWGPQVFDECLVADSKAGDQPQLDITMYKNIVFANEDVFKCKGDNKGFMELPNLPDGDRVNFLEVYPFIVDAFEKQLIASQLDGNVPTQDQVRLMTAIRNGQDFLFGEGRGSINVVWSLAEPTARNFIIPFMIPDLQGFPPTPDSAEDLSFLFFDAGKEAKWHLPTLLYANPRFIRYNFVPMIKRESLAGLKVCSGDDIKAQFYKLDVIDPENEPLQLEVEGMCDGVTVETQVDQIMNLFTFTISNEANGVCRFVLKAEDGKGPGIADLVDDYMKNFGIPVSEGLPVEFWVVAQNQCSFDNGSGKWVPPTNVDPVLELKCDHIDCGDDNIVRAPANGFLQEMLSTVDPEEEAVSLVATITDNVGNSHNDKVRIYRAPEEGKPGEKEAAPMRWSPTLWSAQVSGELDPGNYDVTFEAADPQGEKSQLQVTLVIPQR